MCKTLADIKIDHLTNRELKSLTKTLNAQLELILNKSRMPWDNSFKTKMKIEASFLNSILNLIDREPSTNISEFFNEFTCYLDKENGSVNYAVYLKWHNQAIRRLKRFNMDYQEKIKNKPKSLTIDKYRELFVYNL